MNLANKQAFPNTQEMDEGNGITYQVPIPGMTYREWLAGMVMAHSGKTSNPQNDADKAVQRADRLIEELEK